MKKIILNADDFGRNKDVNNAIVEAFRYGYLKSVSVIVNSKEFLNITNTIKKYSNISFGVHLNLLEGELLTKTTLKKIFFSNFAILFLCSFNKKILKEIEKEFRAQIELAQKYFKISHIDSHIHIHSIPNIFKLVLKLSDEYNINYIRTQKEKPYFALNNKSNIFKYLINLFKVALLNLFTYLNKKHLKKYPNIKTNETVIGINYSGIINSTSVLEGVKKNKSNLVEIIIHPCNENNDFLVTKDEMLFDLIKKMGFEITNFQTL